MKIFINDKETACEQGYTLEKVLETNGIDTRHAAVALDLEVIPREEWGKTRPRDGSSILVIKAAQGG
ncbi:MAG: sulfur carrier protein ThiS [Odoribacteraceae bacterium]|jgi:thiamine biosynthesis protein ThiS|nr:sulfur carrier protein ThiS [Odoribacteraceae bacterium]